MYMRILIADDDQISLALLENALIASGHDVVTARNGAEAFRVLLSDPVRLVISDLQMPEMNGLELCEAIRDHGFSSYVYVILLSAHDGTADTVAGLSAGADEFMRKPFDPVELTLRIRTAERILSLDARDLTIFALAKLAESRDSETGAHLDRVRNYSRLLAGYLQHNGPYQDKIDGNFVQLIYTSSPLHDIGKVAIPDCVLLKPGRLSDREYEIMKTHTTLGAQTLDAALREHPGARFLQMAKNIAATHHERWDGNGYPLGLRGTAIPLCGRIVAVADVYDALTSKRVYKAAFSHEVAMSTIVQGSGEHFDPAVVQAFLALEPQFIAIQSKYVEPIIEAA
jgi:putative two-component system response regulator